MTTCSRCTTTWTGMKVEHCVVCCSTFTGTTAGDLHRTGDHAVSVGPNRRRCLTETEMEARGMARNSKGHWMSGTGKADFQPPGAPSNRRTGWGWGNHPGRYSRGFYAIWVGGRIAI